MKPFTGVVADIFRLAAYGLLLYRTDLLGAPTVLGWNDLGMHCMDNNYSVFSLLPPYNTIHAQVIDAGRLVTGPGNWSANYQAVPDLLGLINTTSGSKTEFWLYASALYGANLAPESGLAGFAMPESANTPQSMTFDPGYDWFSAEGIPVTPWSDGMVRNFYPMMRVAASNSAALPRASTDIVLPVSDEMDCARCHASGQGSAARPAVGWVWATDPARDVRLNILLRHDQDQLGQPGYTAALAAAGYAPSGLFYTVAALHQPILCARCHKSNALPGTGQASIPPLTRAIHSFHASVIDPDTERSLEVDSGRGACYRCHPGSQTRCLRGVMGNAIAADGTRSIQCQSCHGSMSRVGAPGREGWLDEPTCQACHTGTATGNNGQLRYLSALANDGRLRQAVNETFATELDRPAPGLSLYRFSRGHGGLACEACHGSTHAEFPSSEENDNAQSIRVQGHVGMLIECASCHVDAPQTANGGPHGMHTVGQAWISLHDNIAERNSRQCQTCHGLDYRGTVLSRMQADRTLEAFGRKSFWRGAQIGCYTCHRGPSNDNRTSNRAPVVNNATASTAANVPVTVPLRGTDADNDAFTFRIVTQPKHGTVALGDPPSASSVYRPDPNYTGSDTFTFAAWDGSIDSNLGVVTVNVTPGPCQLTTGARVPVIFGANAPVPFAADAVLTTCHETIDFDWDFGDGSAHAATNFVVHTYSAPGEYTWTLTARAGESQAQVRQRILIQGPTEAPVLTISGGGRTAILSWNWRGADVGLESTTALAAEGSWLSLDIPGVDVGDKKIVIQPIGETTRFYRLRAR
ncbi:MAG: PKD domain-containing protein [Verrucomicrobiota bacterium]